MKIENLTEMLIKFVKTSNVESSISKSICLCHVYIRSPCNIYGEVCVELVNGPKWLSKYTLDHYILLLQFLMFSLTLRDRVIYFFFF